MKKGIPRVWLRRVVPIIVVGSVFFFLGRSLCRNWTQLREYPWDIDYVYLGLSFLLVAITFVSIVFAWLLILRRLGVELSFGKGFRIWFLSTLGKYIPGKVWQALGMFYLCRREGISVEKSATSFILVQALSVIPGVALFLAAVNLIKPGFGGSFYGLLFLIPLGLILIHPPILESLVNFISRRLKREEIRFRARYRDMLGLMLIYFVSWLLYGCAFLSLVRAMTPVHPRYVLAFGGVFAGAYLLGQYAVFVPGGLGIREGALTFLLLPLFPLPVATSLSIAARIWLTVAELVCVAVSVRGLKNPAAAVRRGETGDNSVQLFT